MTMSFRHFARLLFSRNSASTEFRENKTLAKFSEFTVVDERRDDPNRADDGPTLNSGLVAL